MSGGEKVNENAAEIGEKVLGPSLRDLMDKHRLSAKFAGSVSLSARPRDGSGHSEPLAPYGRTSAAMTELVAECKSTSSSYELQPNACRASGYDEMIEVKEVWRSWMTSSASSTPTTWEPDDASAFVLVTERSL